MKVSDICKNIPLKKGEVGLEIEVEGVNLPRAPLGWDKVHDGSLRGESGEYVLTQPISRNSITKFLNRMKKANEEASFNIIESNRQSIHVHINVQDMEVTKMFNFILLFLLFEESLVKYCGESRVGNLFCLRSIDAGGLITKLENAVSSVDKFYELNTNDLRYSAINVQALFKYGSLEFRSLRGTDDYKLIEDWVTILLSLKDAANTMSSPLELVQKFSSEGIESFVFNILGVHSGVVFNDSGAVDNLYSQMREIQSIIYTGDWEAYSSPADVDDYLPKDAVEQVKRYRFGGDFNILLPPLGPIEDE